MPLFLIERNFAKKLELTAGGVSVINEVNDLESVRWLSSFLRVEKKKTFCLYEAASTEAFQKAASQAGIPAGVIVEIREEIVPGRLIQALETRCCDLP